MFFETIRAQGTSASADHCSPALAAGDFLAVSGQLPIDPCTGTLCSDVIGEQVIQCLKNLYSLLHAKGIGMRHIMSMRIYLTDMNDAQLVDELLAKTFEDGYPAVSYIGVNGLLKEAKIQIEAFAIDTRALEVLCAGEEHGSCEGCGGC